MDCLLAVLPYIAAIGHILQRLADWMSMTRCHIDKCCLLSSHRWMPSHHSLRCRIFHTNNWQVHKRSHNHHSFDKSLQRNWYCARNDCEARDLQLAEPRSSVDITALNSSLSTPMYAWLGFNRLENVHFEFNSDEALVNATFPYQDPSVSTPFGHCGTALRTGPMPCHAAWYTGGPTFGNAQAQCGMWHIHGGLANNKCTIGNAYFYGICEDAADTQDA